VGTSAVESFISISCKKCSTGPLGLMPTSANNWVKL